MSWTEENSIKLILILEIFVCKEEEEEEAVTLEEGRVLSSAMATSWLLNFFVRSEAFGGVLLLLELAPPESTDAIFQQIV